jgi:hypothetical protein
MRALARAGALVLLTAATACSGSTGTATSLPPAPSPSVLAGAQVFEVNGLVSDDAGKPLPSIVVTMRHWVGGLIQSPAALTDTAGAYTIRFTANPWNSSSGPAAARAELIADGYEWYYRTVLATGPRLVENFRLHPVHRITPGQSVALPLAPDDGECVSGLSWTVAICRTVRVTTQAGGSMMVQATSQGDAGQPLVSVCCVSGDDRAGNPLTLPVAAATEFTVEVGLTGGFTTTQPVVVTTAFTP